MSTLCAPSREEGGLGSQIWAQASPDPDRLCLADAIVCPFAVRNLSHESNSMLSPPNHQPREGSRGAPVCLHTEKGLSSSPYRPGDHTNMTQRSSSAAPKGKGAPLRWLPPSEEPPQHRPGPHGAVGFHSGLQGQVGQLDPSYFDSDLAFSTQKKLVKMR